MENLFESGQAEVLVSPIFILAFHQILSTHFLKNLIAFISHHVSKVSLLFNSLLLLSCNIMSTFAKK